jgi:hypothetical protein
MIDIESTVTAALRADADQPVRADGLHERALARARMIRVRRRLAGAAAGTGLAVALVAGLVTVHSLAGGGSAGPPATPAEPSASPPPGTKPPGTNPPGAKEPTTLPGAAGMAGAVDAPAEVGTDPRLIHFDLSLGALEGMASAEWTSATGFERVELRSRNGRPQVEVLLGRDPNRLDEVANAGMSLAEERQPTADPPMPATVNGRPGTLVRYGWAHKDEAFSWVLRWQPVDGLHARVGVYQNDPGAAREAAEALRLDVAQRCAFPLRLAATPADTTLVTCGTALRREPVPTRGVWMHTLLRFATSSGGSVALWAEEDLVHGSIDTSQFVPNRTVAGRPAQWRTADPAGLWILGFAPTGDLFISGASEAEAIRVGNGLTFVGDLADPHTWPELPAG